MLKLPKDKRGGRNTAQIRSSKQEDEIAARTGGRKTLASGALGDKGDVRVKNILRIEAKTTSKQSFRVTKDMIRKIEEAAIPNNELPALEIEFLDSKGKPCGSVCVVPTYVLEMMGEFKNEANK